MREELLNALAEARQEFGEIVRSSENRDIQREGGSYKYASLGAVIRAVLPALEKHGLSLHQTFRWQDNKYHLLTTLEHNSSGAVIESMLPVNVSGDLYSLGGSITYLRRYSIVSMLSLTTEEDTDGAGSRGKKVVEETMADKGKRAILDAGDFLTLQKKITAVGEKEHLFANRQEYEDVLKVALRKAEGYNEQEKAVLNGLVCSYTSKAERELEHG